MSKYVISVNYDATYVAEVDANDERDALGKARQMAEEADVREFQIRNEKEARVLARNEKKKKSCCFSIIIDKGTNPLSKKIHPNGLCPIFVF